MMNSLLNSARVLSNQICRTVWQKTQPSFLTSSSAIRCRLKSSDTKDEVNKYQAYPEYDTPSPFVPIKAHYKFGYHQKYYNGGPLPRSEKHKDKPYKHLPKFDAKSRDQWTEKKALFGQNDYIDILGDGTIHPVDLIKGPAWLRGFKGNELMRLSRRLSFEGRYLQLVRPAEHHNIRKQIFFLYKRYNHHRGHKNYWSGKQGKVKSRLFNIRKW